jgi:hypothetical protein
MFDFSLLHFEVKIGISSCLLFLFPSLEDPSPTRKRATRLFILFSPPMMETTLMPGFELVSTKEIGNCEVRTTNLPVKLGNLDDALHHLTNLTPSTRFFIYRTSLVVCLYGRKQNEHIFQQIICSTFPSINCFCTLKLDATEFFHHLVK